MSSLNEIVYNVLNIYRGGNTSDNEKIQKRQIGFMVDYYRAMLIRRDLNRKTNIDKSLISDLGCVPMKEVDRAECCELEVHCTVYRTVMKIPSTVNTSSLANMFTFIGKPDKRTGGSNAGIRYQLSSNVQAGWAQHNKYTGNMAKVYYHNGYIYLEDPNDGTKFINIQGVFEKPSDLAIFETCKGAECVTWDSRYPAPEWMIATITELILTKELNIQIQSINDETNNAQKQPTQETQSSV